MRDDKFDVFICHRGPDTKLTFASHLYEASKNAGISAFFDIESLVKGEDSWKCIERVISTKPIALVIFSKTFAESEWCLKELHLFLKRLPHVEVIPIFYDVRPEDVKMLPISSTIEQQDVRFQYRDDLEKASRIAGYCREESRTDAELVAKIVEHVNRLSKRKRKRKRKRLLQLRLRLFVRCLAIHFMLLRLTLFRSILNPKGPPHVKMKPQAFEKETLASETELIGVDRYVHLKDIR